MRRVSFLAHFNVIRQEPTLPAQLGGLWSGEIQQHHIRMLLRSFKDNFAAVWRDVEVANVEVGSEVGQLPLGARLKVDEPEILMLDLSSQEHECPSSRQKGQVSSPPS